jgi:protein TonB
MSRLSIFETRWINLVFENRNQEYGAYQLRRESAKSSLTALFTGLLFVAALGVIPTISSYFSSNAAPVISPTVLTEPIKVTDVTIHEMEKKEATALPEVKSQVTEVPIDKKPLRNPIIVNPNEANPDIATNKENVNTTTRLSNGIGTIGVNPTSGKGTGATTETPKVEDTGSTIANVAALDKTPEFPGGMKSFYTYISRNFEKPEIDDMNTIKVLVYFVIEKDGSMTDIRVTRDPGYGLGKEAIRVLKSLKTKWTPGMINSKPVRTAYNLPISVEIQ